MHRRDFTWRRGSKKYGRAVAPTRVFRLGQVSSLGCFRSKVSGDQIVRTPAAANVDLGSGGAYRITVGIERVQKTDG